MPAFVNYALPRRDDAPPPDPRELGRLARRAGVSFAYNPYRTTDGST